MNNENNNQVQGFNGVNQPINNGQYMNNQPMNNGQMMQQPMNNGQMMNQQPMNNQPMYGQMPQQPMYNQPVYNQQPMNNKMGNNKKNIGIGIVAFIVGFIVVYFIVTSLGGSKSIKGAWNCTLAENALNVNIKDDKNIELVSGGATIRGTYTKSSYKVKKEYKKSGYSYTLIKIETTEYSYYGTTASYNQHLELLMGVKGKEAHIISVSTDGTINQGTCTK